MVIDRGVSDLSRMQDVDDAFIDGNTRSDRKDQDRNDETPEIDLFSVPERKLIVGWLPGLFQSVEQQPLVAGVHAGVYALRQHR